MIMSRSSLMFELIDVLGEKSANSLINEIGGLRIYVPLKATHTHQLNYIMEYDDFVKLCEHFGGEYVEFPNNARSRSKRAQIIKGDGISNKMLAKQIGCTERYVRIVRSEIKDNMNQIDMFGDG